MLLVKNFSQIVANVLRFQEEINKKEENKLLDALGYFAYWYAYKYKAEGKKESWLFAPSVFIGYQGITAENYKSLVDNDIDCRVSDAFLAK